MKEILKGSSLNEHRQEKEYGWKPIPGKKKPVKKSSETCSTLKIRINDSICRSEIYSFSMSGSTSAISFISTKFT